jgi:fructokinase
MAGLLAMAHHTGLLGSASKPELRHLDRDTVTGLLQAATQVAAVTCGRRGANSPTAAELAAFGS